MTIEFTGVVSDSLAKQIAQKIRDAILTGRLTADQRLPTEEQLAEQFEVSRPTIREALKRLAAQNLVRSRRGPAGGTFVNRPEIADVREYLTTMSTLLVSFGAFSLEEIAEARREFDRICCVLAAARRNEVQFAVMEAETALQGDAALSHEDFCASDVRFHRALVDAAGNPVLSFMMSVIVEGSQPAANLVIFRHRNRQIVVGQHRRLLEALRRGDAAGACESLADLHVTLAELYAKSQTERSGEHTAPRQT